MKSLGAILLLLLAITGPLFANEEATTLESAEAHYDGKVLTLVGKVVLEHPIGTIFANQVVMTPSGSEKKFCFGLFDLSKDVKFIFREGGGQLTCGTAQLDYQAFTGKFYGDVEQEFVRYTEKGHGKTKRALEIQGGQMTLRINNNSGKRRCCVTNILAENQVTVTYDDDFIATSDRASYQRLNHEGDQPLHTSMPGLITLRSFEDNGICKVTNRNGDLITAKQIGINTISQQICFSYPKGALFIVKEGQQGEKMEFSSDTLLWDEKNGVMTLREHVVIDQKGFGRVVTDEEVKLFQHKEAGKSQIKTFESTGKTVLTRSEENKNRVYTVTCHGRLTVDHLKLAVVMESPCDSQGNVLEGQQVVYQDPIGEIYADRAVIEYGLNDNSIIPAKVILTGHVRLLDNSTVEAGMNSALTKYALSDKLEYYPSQREAIFTADKGNRVLFYSKANDLQVSAPSLKIKRDEITHKDSIKGTGDVRFTFIENEFEQLKNRFSLSQKNKEIRKHE